MIYIYPNTLSTFNGNRDIALENGYIEITEETYADLVETKKKWDNGNIVDDPTYPSRKAEEEEEARKQGIRNEINDLKRELSSYDYIGVKIAMGVATRDDYATEIAYTETLRVRIRELEGEL